MRFFRLVAVGFVVLAAVGCAGESTASPLDGVATVVPDPTVVVVEADVGVPDPTAVVEPSVAPTEAPTVVEEPTSVPTEVAAEPTVAVVPTALVEPTAELAPLEYGPTTEPSAMTPEEREVRRIHTRFMTELFNYDERTGQRGMSLDLVEELTSGTMRDSLLEFIASRESASDFWVVPGYAPEITAVVFSPDRSTAAVQDCWIDTAELFDREGTLLEPIERSLPKLVATQLDQVDGIWRVSRFVTGGNDRCARARSL